MASGREIWQLPRPNSRDAGDTYLTYLHLKSDTYLYCTTFPTETTIICTLIRGQCYIESVCQLWKLDMSESSVHVWVTLYRGTVKATNFGPLFQKGLLSSKLVLQKKWRMKVVEKRQIYKYGSAHFWYMIHPKKLRNLQNKVQGFHEVWVRGFYGILNWGFT
jgi:hypothetical protein